MDYSKVALTGNKVMVLFDDDTKPTKTKSGIHIPESAKQQYSLGEVLAIGPEADERLKVGTRCMWLPQSGAGLKLENGDAIVVMRDIDLLYFYLDNSVEKNFTPSLN